jgi:putative dimethyl sulfoxide reductase chaperone
MQIPVDTIELLQARAVLYGAISSVFTRPADEKFQLFRREDFRQEVMDAANCYDETVAADPATLGHVAVTMIDAYRREEKILDDEYVRVFGHTLSKKTSPYELEHLQNQEVFYKTQCLADISGFYRAFGLQVRPKERVDFISIEAEFLSYLVIKELAARQRQPDDDGISVVRNAQRDFLRDHFARWVVPFGTAVAEQSEAQFYRNAGMLLGHFIEYELSYIEEGREEV